MTKRTRRTYSTEFKLEAAQLVVEQGYSVIEAAKAMNVSKSAMNKWVRQLKAITPKTASLTPNEDDSRIIYKHVSENLSRIRQMCMSFIKLVEMKGALKRRQMKCALNTEYREELKCF